MLKFLFNHNLLMIELVLHCMIHSRIGLIKVVLLTL